MDEYPFPEHRESTRHSYSGMWDSVTPLCSEEMLAVYERVRDTFVWKHSRENFTKNTGQYGRKEVKESYFIPKWQQDEAGAWMALGGGARRVSIQVVWGFFDMSYGFRLDGIPKDIHQCILLSDTDDQCVVHVKSSRYLIYSYHSYSLDLWFVRPRQPWRHPPGPLR